MLVTVTPAELITTDVMKMTLDAGPGFDVVAFAFCLAVPVDDGGEPEDELVGFLTTAGINDWLLWAARGRSAPFAPIEATTVPSGRGKKSLELEVSQHPTSGRFASQQ